MCARHLSMVPAMAAAVPAVDNDWAAHDMDRQHYPNLLRLAFAQRRTPLGDTGLDYAAGIRSAGSVRCGHRCAQVPATGNAPVLCGIAQMRDAIRPRTTTWFWERLCG